MDESSLNKQKAASENLKKEKQKNKRHWIESFRVDTTGTRNTLACMTMTQKYSSADF